jgi:hypothetical protein
MPTWIAILIGAAGTWIIALIAVGGPILRLILAPRLQIERNGFSGTTATHNNGQKARYYFVWVKNRWRRVSAAHEVQLVLTRIEKSGAAGPEIIFDEIMPLPWQRQEYERLLTRTVGSPAVAGIFYVQGDGVFSFTPATAAGGVAAHFPQPHQGASTWWITLRALSIEADSPSQRLKIDWNGQWPDGKAEIERACTVTIDPE